jgi:hypothetical protein
MTAEARATVSRCTSTAPAAARLRAIAGRSRLARPTEIVSAPRSGSPPRKHPMPSANPTTKIAPPRALFVVSRLASRAAPDAEPRSRVPRPRPPRSPSIAATGPAPAIGKHPITARPRPSEQARSPPPLATSPARSPPDEAGNCHSAAGQLTITPFRRAFRGRLRPIATSTRRPALVGAGRRGAANFRG